MPNFGTNIDLENNQFKNTRVENITSTLVPSLSKVGKVAFNTNTNEIEFDSGTSIVKLKNSYYTVINTFVALTTLNLLSNSLIEYVGTTFGSVLNLGIATTYLNGKTFSVFNNSVESVSINLNDNSLYIKLEPYCSITLILEKNVTANGVWINHYVYPKFLKEFCDDFVTGSSSLGETNWITAFVGIGSGFAQPTTLISSTMGAVQLTAGTTAISSASITKNANVYIPTVSTGVNVSEYRVLIPAISDVNGTYVARIGYGDTTVPANENTNGVFFITNANNTLDLKTVKAGVATIITTGIPIVLNRYFNLKIEIDYALTNCQFYIDNTLLGVITTNIPVVGITPQVRISKTVGLTVKTICVDYIKIRSYIIR